jgi:hypothetical protein
MWEKAVSAYFKELTQYSPGEIEENREDPQSKHSRLRFKPGTS